MRVFIFITILLHICSIKIFGNEKINLYLKWRHSFQFAGYYAAQKEGYYKQEGLDVDIIKNKGFKNINYEKILSQKNNYGIATSKILLNKKLLRNLKIISVIFQHSPLVIASLKSSKIRTPQDFYGKKYLGYELFAELKAVLVKEGVDFHSIKLIDKKTGYMQRFMNGKDYLLPGYITTLPYQLNKLGIKYHLIRITDYGIDFYGDFIFTSKKEVDEEPKKVDKFVKASIKGWNYALNHKSEIAKYIIKKYKVKISYDALMYEANILEKDIILHKIIEIGHLNLGRWRNIGHILKSLKLIDKDFNIRDIIYSKKEASIWKNNYFIYLIYIILAISLIILILIIFNLQLNREVKKKIREIKEKDIYFQEIFNNNFQFMGILSLDGKLKLVNKSFLTLINKKESDVIGKYFWNTLWFKHSKRVQEKIKTAIKDVNKKEFIRFEITSKGANGKLYFIDFSIKVLKNNKIIESYIIEGRDITDYKNMEVAVSNSQKMQAVGGLAAGIAHDFNNIISGIIGYAEYIKLNLDTEKNLKETNEIIKAGKRAKRLVSRIITFSKGVEENKQNINLITLIDEMIKLIRPTLKSKNAVVNLKYKKNLPIYAVYTQIEQIVMNITKNALQAIGDNGVVNIFLDIINIKNELILFDSVLPINKYMKLTISDSGSGITKENLSKVFEPYFSTKSKKDGTGLGLFVVRGLVIKNSGFIDVKSEINRGTVFDLYFPVVYDDFDDIKTYYKKDVDFLDVKNKHILFVDDEKMITSSISMILIKKGYLVDAFTNPIEAYNSFKEKYSSYDIIITDQSMPEMTGIELISKIKKIRKDIPIILCSGYNNIINNSNMLDYNINDYLEKPIMINKLELAIKNLLSNNS